MPTVEWIPVTKCLPVCGEWPAFVLANGKVTIAFPPIHEEVDIDPVNGWHVHEPSCRQSLWDDWAISGVTHWAFIEFPPVPTPDQLPALAPQPDPAAP